jgi:hypothetical protein
MRAYGKAVRSWLPTIVVAVSVTAWFLGTQRWLTWDAGVRYLGEGDVLSYQVMAEAAPKLPSVTLGSAYTARFPVHYAIGLLARLTPLTVHETYGVGVAVCIGAIAWTAWLILGELAVPRPWRAVAVSLLCLDPYSFRYYVMAPGMVADLVFVTGLGLSILALLRRRPGLLLVGAVIASAARQTALVALPVMALWMLLEGRGKPRQPRWRLVAAVVAVLPVVVWAMVSVVVHPFTKPFGPRIPQDTILPLLQQLPQSLPGLGTHVLRVAIPFVLPLVVLGVVTVRDWRRGPRKRLHFWGLMALSAAIVIQPLGIGDTFPGFAYNEPRLSAIGLLPFVLALGVRLSTIRFRLTPGWGTVVATAIALASLHHVYTTVGPKSLAQFLVIQLVAAAAVAVCLWQALTAERADDDERGTPGRGSGKEAARERPQEPSALVERDGQEDDLVAVRGGPS